MPLQKIVKEFPFGGLDQKSHAIFKAEGMLEDAVNVIYDKKGALEKRRGYDRMGDASGDVFGTAVETCFHGLAVFRGELLVFGINSAYSVCDKNGTRALVRRGPCVRGAIRRTHFATAPMSSRTS